jgi:hypothetical protein
MHTSPKRKRGTRQHIRPISQTFSHRRKQSAPQSRPQSSLCALVQNEGVGSRLRIQFSTSRNRPAIDSRPPPGRVPIRYLQSRRPCGIWNGRGGCVLRSKTRLRVQHSSVPWLRPTMGTATQSWSAVVAWLILLPLLPVFFCPPFFCHLALMRSILGAAVPRWVSSVVQIPHFFAASANFRRPFPSLFVLSHFRAFAIPSYDRLSISALLRAISGPCLIRVIRSIRGFLLWFRLSGPCFNCGSCLLRLQVALC